MNFLRQCSRKCSYYIHTDASEDITKNKLAIFTLPLYLGVLLVSCRNFKCDFHHAKSRFFGAFNSLYSKVGRLGSEEVILSLLQSKCLPKLLYATEVCPLLSRDRQSLEFTITRIFMKIFCTSSSAIVKDCQCNFNFFCRFSHG